MTKEEKLLKAVHHVVHDYANLVSSGMMAVTGCHHGTQLVPPVNTHVGHAFLVNCRKMSDFFTKSPQQDDIWAGDFLGHMVAFDLANDTVMTQLAALPVAVEVYCELFRGHGIVVDEVTEMGFIEL